MYVLEGFSSLNIKNMHYRFDALLQTVNFLLEQMERSGLAPVPGKGRCACRMNGIDPFLQFNLARSLHNHNI